MGYSLLSDINGNGMTKLVRGKIRNNRWTNEEVLFQADENLYIKSNHHFGSRIVFDDKGHLFFSIGDRGKRALAQDLSAYDNFSVCAAVEGGEIDFNKESTI